MKNDKNMNNQTQPNLPEQIANRYYEMINNPEYISSQAKLHDITEDKAREFCQAWAWNEFKNKPIFEDHDLKIATFKRYAQIIS